MTPILAVFYSFLFGLLHGVLPDEHTWPITFSYAIGSAGGWAGMKAGLYFSAAFTLQRALLSEAAYLALAPFLLSPTINGIVYIVVGLVMSGAGFMIVFGDRIAHVHLIGRCRRAESKGNSTGYGAQTLEQAGAKTSSPKVIPARWAMIHGFIAGFGFGGFSLFVNTVAAPKMGSPLLGFLPGLVFGLGTMIVLAAVGALFGASLRWSRSLTVEEVARIGTQTGGRTLLFGGLLFAAAGAATLLGLDRNLPVDTGYVLVGLFMILIAVPAFIYSLREVQQARNSGNAAHEDKR